MTDWESLRVADLKEELKSRGVPSTGLKLKQHFIDKLNELDAEAEIEIENHVVAPEHDIPQQSDEAENKQQVSTNGAGSDDSQTPPLVDANDHSSNVVEGNPDEARKNTALTESPPAKAHATEDGLAKGTQVSDSGLLDNTSDRVAVEARIEKLPRDLPAELKKEESQARDGTTPPAVGVENATDRDQVQEDDPFIAQGTDQVSDEVQMVTSNPGISQQEVVSGTAADKMEIQATDNSVQLDTQIVNSTNSVVPTNASSPDEYKEQRKRKRRSTTPGPDSDDVAHKRARAESAAPETIQGGSNAIERVQAATDAAQSVRDLSSFDHHAKEDPARPRKRDGTPARLKTSSSNDGNPDVLELRQRSKDSRSPSPTVAERGVSPAVHQATRSLYIRNFKRPLHIPTLRSHIQSLAGSSSDDDLKIFYLDSIRTHAFLSFASISAASRVRNAMHNSRFPNEPMRDMLWVDFIPDEDAQNWIDQETGGNSGSLGGGRGSAKRYEVVYIDDNGGVTAVLQEASNIHPQQQQRPNIQPSRSNRMVPQDPTASAAVSSGIHPSRTSTTPMSPTASRSNQQRQSYSAPSSSNPGKGFRALDELFSSTTTKPKLYYKLPSQDIIDDRSEMIQNLRVGHTQMGQSGDGGMKRYSFERSERSGKEDWVDKGPEFGFGRRGQERLTGTATGFGNNRGRGGIRGGRKGGDSWRGR